MRDKVTGSSGKNGNLNRIFLQLENVSVRRGVDSCRGDEEVISSKRSVPVNVLSSELANKTRQRARGSVRREGYEEEVSLVRVLREKWAVNEEIVEDRS